ncbi:hypothetical protein EPUL_001394 [Erysiphe pulchra]|uniref:HAUS augmin-like complex subunit 3 N-terminal domain-containing protein n=1 Tax=Erysiphe pulchra TaxID=225359 RepID=A0A2S4PXI1_9PEZI|nr:hypothetical protein EPUL_001394 [Erysiphe pulchra]
MAEALFKQITKVLHDRDILYDPDALRSVIASNITILQEWVEEYLSPDTLLSKDEHRLFTTLTKTGEIETLSKEQDLSFVLQINDHDLQIAIDELRKSTATIEKQCETLRIQKNALSSLSRNIKRANQARSQVEKGQLRKWEAEKSSIAATISDSVQSLIFKSSDQAQYLKTSDINFKQAISNILQLDDRLLSSFQKLASDLDENLPENEETIERVKDLCARYIKFTVEGMRTKLDRIYLEALKDPSNNQNSQENVQQAQELQEELESLYSEIQPVAQISVEQQFLEPAMRVTNNINNTYYERFCKSIQYIENSLSSLTDRIKAYSLRAHEYQCHRMAVKAVLKIVKAELSYEEPPVSKTKLLAGPTQKIPSIVDETYGEIKPEQSLAQNLGITLPKSGSEEINVLKMEKILSEKVARLESQEEILQKTMESSISSYLSDAHLTFALLRDELLDKSPYHEVNLIDPELLKTMDLLETEILKFQAKLEAIDLYDLQEKNSQRDYFLERWSK